MGKLKEKPQVAGRGDGSSPPKQIFPVRAATGERRRGGCLSGIYSALEEPAEGTTFIGALMGLLVAVIIVVDMGIISLGLYVGWTKPMWGYESWLSSCSPSFTWNEDCCIYLYVHLGLIGGYALEFVMRFLFACCIPEVGGLGHLFRPMVVCDGIALAGLALDLLDLLHPTKFYVFFRLPRLLQGANAFWQGLKALVCYCCCCCGCCRQPEADGAAGETEALVQQSDKPTASAEGATDQPGYCTALCNYIMEADWGGMAVNVIIMLIVGWAVYLKAAEEALYLTSTTTTTTTTTSAR